MLTSTWVPSEPLCAYNPDAKATQMHNPQVGRCFRSKRVAGRDSGKSRLFSCRLPAAPPLFLGRVFELAGPADGQGPNTPAEPVVQPARKPVRWVVGTGTRLVFEKHGLPRGLFPALPCLELPLMFFPLAHSLQFIAALPSSYSTDTPAPAGSPPAVGRPGRGRGAWAPRAGFRPDTPPRPRPSRPRGPLRRGPPAPPSYI